ncbi:hypothetical protein FRC04_009653 [Tulasnella sp. 424]|nr:hypothetical protein FRC04_009653 [Tulasnella sp. 424]
MSSSSDLEPPATLSKNWPSKIVNNVLRSICKRRAKKLLVQLVGAADEKDKSTRRRQRHEAAAALVEMAQKERGGEEIVARRFVKTKSRREAGTRALLTLSDVELDEVGFGLIDTASPKSVSINLLRIVKKYANDANFFKKTISPAIEFGAEGVLAILDLATHNPLGFFGNTDPKLILNFSERVIGTNKFLSPRWYCGVRLVLTVLDKAPPHAWEESELPPSLLPSLFKGIIEERQASLNPDVPEGSPQKLAFHSFRLLPLARMCCNKIGGKFESIVWPPPETLNSFVKLLIDLVHPHNDDGLRCLNAERAWALWTLIPLLKFPPIVKLVPNDILSSFGGLFMDMALHSWILDADASEERMLRYLMSTLGSTAISALCRLPESIFDHALTSALQDGIVKLESSSTKPYEPLNLVERLLWLSNPPIIKPAVLHAVVNGGSCAFLARTLSYTGDLDPQDRGLWRAKGLAITCLGNIVERMNHEQLRSRISKEMIDAVVEIKEDGDAPLVQRGQAIFMLQRYTLAADRYGVQPYYREDVSTMADASRSVNADDTDPGARGE